MLLVRVLEWACCRCRCGAAAGAHAGVGSLLAQVPWCDCCWCRGGAAAGVSAGVDSSQAGTSRWGCCRCRCRDGVAITVPGVAAGSVSRASSSVCTAASAAVAVVGASGGLETAAVTAPGIAAAVCVPRGAGVAPASRVVSVASGVVLSAVHTPSMSRARSLLGLFSGRLLHTRSITCCSSVGSLSRRADAASDITRDRGLPRGRYSVQS